MRACRLSTSVMQVISTRSAKRLEEFAQKVSENAEGRLEPPLGFVISKSRVQVPPPAPRFWNSVRATADAKKELVSGCPASVIAFGSRRLAWNCDGGLSAMLVCR